MKLRCRAKQNDYAGNSLCKKFISGLLAVALLAATNNMSAFAIDSEELSTSGSCGENATWFINSDAELVVSGTGVINRSPWYSLGNDIKRVVVEEGITELKTSQFINCKNIIGIVFPSTITNLGTCLSSKMNNLTDIWLYSDSVINNFYGRGSSYPKPGNGTKWHVYKGTTTETSLREGLKLTDEDFEYITSNQAFPEIENRTPVKVPEVTETSGPCGLLSTYSWDEDTKTLTFEGSGSITVTDYYQRFADKTENIVMDKSNITSICDSAFGQVESISNNALFPKLSKVTFPEMLKSIGDYAFLKTSLTSINLPEGLKEIGDSAFRDSLLSGDLVLPKTLKLIDQEAFSKTNITSVNLNEGMTLGGTAFRSCNYLESVTIPDNLTYSQNGEVNIARANKAFLDCKGLEKVTILGSGTVSKLGQAIENGLGEEMFKGCTSLKEVIIKADDISYVNNDTFDMTNIPKFYIYKGSTTESTLRNAGYLTDTNVVYIANKSALEEAVKSAEDMNVSQYTAESVDALNKAIEDGKSVIEDEGASQEKADNAVKAIKDAIDGLKYPPADYTAVDTALEKVPDDLSIYTDETAKAVTAAVEAVDRTKDITEQEIVDGYAKAIEDAVAALELKPLGSVSGTVKAPEANNITVEVSTNGGVVYTTGVANGEFTIPELESGDYEITFTVENCAPRSYNITVEDGNVEFSAEIHLYGDINGDGKITTTDVGLANAHAKGIKTLDGYELTVADVSKDGKVTTADAGAINSHAQGIRALW